MTTAKRFREIMETLNLNAKELAKELGVSEATISRIKSGSNEIRESILVFLGENYNISIDWLLMGRGTMLVDDASHQSNSSSFKSQEGDDILGLKMKVKELETKLEMVEAFNQKLIDKLGNKVES